MLSMEDFLSDPKDGEQEFYAGEAIAYLLDKEVLFANVRPYVVNPWDPKDKQVMKESTIVLFVNTSDVFVWGGADALPITFNNEINIETNDLYRLTTYVLADELHGSIKYACWKRNLQPQKPRIDQMKNCGTWDDFMESLPAQA